MAKGKISRALKKVAKKTGKTLKAVKKEAAPVVNKLYEDASSVAKAVNKKVDTVVGGAGGILKGGSSLLNSVSNFLPWILGTVVIVAGVYAYSNSQSNKRITGQSWRRYQPSMNRFSTDYRLSY